MLEKIDSLQLVISHVNLSKDTADELLSMQRKEKERLVLKKHKYKISGPFKSGDRTVY